MDLSSLFGLSGFLVFSLGFSESASSHLSGFFRSYTVKKIKKKNHQGNGMLEIVHYCELVRTTAAHTHLNFWFFFNLFLVLLWQLLKSLHFISLFALPSLLLPPLATLLVPQSFTFKLSPPSLFLLFLPDSLNSIKKVHEASPNMTTYHL